MASKTIATAYDMGFCPVETFLDEEQLISLNQDDNDAHKINSPGLLSNNSIYHCDPTD